MFVLASKGPETFMKRRPIEWDGQIFAWLPWNYYKILMYFLILWGDQACAGRACAWFFLDQCKFLPKFATLLELDALARRRRIEHSLSLSIYLCKKRNIWKWWEKDIGKDKRGVEKSRRESGEWRRGVFWVLVTVGFVPHLMRGQKVMGFPSYTKPHVLFFFFFS